MPTAKTLKSKSPKPKISIPTRPAVSAVPIHPLLLKKKIRQTQNWSECLAKFQTSTNFREMIQCLEIGHEFELDSGHSKDERVLFYLSVANGWNDPESFRLPEDDNTYIKIGKERYCLPGVRAVIARKAFEMLCEFTFANVNSRYTGYNQDYSSPMKEFLEGPESYQVLRAIRNFFRIKTGENVRDYGIANLTKLGKDEDLDQAINFLLHLAKFLWKWKERGEDHFLYNKKWNNDMRVEIEDSKQWMIEILWKLDKIELMENWLLKLSALDLLQLKRIALSSMLEKDEHLVSNDRAVESLDEAIYAGSKAGWIFKKYEIAQSVSVDLQQAQAIEKKKKELESQLAELNAKKKK